MAVAAPERVRQDVEHQQVHDRNHNGYQAVLLSRMAAVMAAQRALSAREEGTSYALRQSLVDLAAIAELLAADLPAPH